MLEELKKQYTSFKLLTLLLIIAISIYLAEIFWKVIGAFSDIIIMVVIAWLLSFILEPLVNFISSAFKFSKIISAVIVYTFFTVLISIMIFIFIPIVINQFQSLSTVIPHYLSAYPQLLKPWNTSITKSADVFISLIPSFATIIMDFLLMLILSFYLVVDKARINNELYALAPKIWHKNLKFIQEVIDSTFSSFFRIQVIFGIIAGISTWIILTVFGIGFAASLSLIAGILTIIPVFGPFLGAFPPAFIVLVTKPQTPLEALLIYVILVLIQQIVFNVFGPKLMGNAFKLHPLVVFLSIILGFKIAGALGAVFVVPVLGIVVIVFKRLMPYFINPPESLSEK